MRILHVVHGYLPQFRGGTELYLSRLIAEQKSRGHEIHVLTGTTHTAEAPTVERYAHDGVQVSKIVLSGSYLEHWTRSHSPDAADLFARVVREVRPDIVHVQHWYRLSRNLVETSFRLGIPTVCTLHDLWTTCPRIFRIREETFCDRTLGADSCTSCVPRFPWMDDAMTAREIELFQADFRNELQLADRIVVPSNAHGDLVRRMVDVPSERFSVVPHGTIADVRRRLDVYDRDGLQPKDGKRPIRIGCWGHLFHMKGAHLILEALQEIDQKSRFEVHIWGKVVEPRYKERLEAAAKGLNVVWHGGFVPKDVEEQPLDVAVIPSLCAESFSFVLDEAFRLGLPVIVSDRGALAERVGGAGATFEAESSRALAKVFIQLLRDRGLIDRWRSEIPALVEMRDHASKIIEIYQDVVEGHRDLPVRPDLDLPNRRVRHLAQTIRDQEKLIFGYLGHIKRESGRGDHYESVVKKMIAEQHQLGRDLNESKDAVKTLTEQSRHQAETIEFLAREIDEFRQAVNQVHQATVEVPHPDHTVPDVPEHIPGLGSTASIRDVDHKMLAEYEVKLRELKVAAEAVELRQRLLERERRIADLDTIIAGMNSRLADRQARIGELDSSSAEKRRQLHELENENLGLKAMLEECRSESKELRILFERQQIESVAMESELAAAREARSALTTRVGELESELGDARSKIKDATRRAELEGRTVFVLSGMVDTFRKALAKIHDAELTFRDPTMSLAKDIRDVDAPNLGRLGDAMRRNGEMVVGFIDALRSLRQRAEQGADAAAKLSEAESRLATKEAMIAHLGTMIEDMRRALTSIFAEVPNFEPCSEPGTHIGDHVPLLGDLDTIRSTNLDLIERFLDELRKIRHG